MEGQSHAMQDRIPSNRLLDVCSHQGERLLPANYGITADDFADRLRWADT
jgi:hypothetical protein